MRPFWDTIEMIDQTAFKALDKLGKLRGKPSFRKQAEESVKDIREPQKAITFDA